MTDIHVIVSRQVKRWDLERKAFEESQKEEKKTVERPADVKPVVTISRQRGCRGGELAKLLAHELNYGFFDRNIVDYIAQHMGIRSELVESLDEKDRSELELWINNLFSNRVFDHDEYIRALGESVKTMALQGGVVILGRGVNFLLADTPSYHVRLTAPLSVRMDNLRQFEGKTESEAMEEIKKVDRERSAFVYRYFKKSIDDPLAYDLTINIAKLKMDGAIKIILTALRARGWTLEMTGGDKRKKNV